MNLTKEQKLNCIRGYKEAIKICFITDPKNNDLGLRNKFHQVIFVADKTIERYSDNVLAFPDRDFYNIIQNIRMNAQESLSNIEGIRVVEFLKNRLLGLEWDYKKQEYKDSKK